jgi:hypothetical protein
MEPQQPTNSLLDIVDETDAAIAKKESWNPERLDNDVVTEDVINEDNGDVQQRFNWGTGVISTFTKYNHIGKSMVSEGLKTISGGFGNFANELVNLVDDIDARYESDYEKKNTIHNRNNNINKDGVTYVGYPARPDTLGSLIDDADIGNMKLPEVPGFQKWVYNDEGGVSFEDTYTVNEFWEKNFKPKTKYGKMGEYMMSHIAAFITANTVFKRVPWLNSGSYGSLKSVEIATKGANIFESVPLPMKKKLIKAAIDLNRSALGWGTAGYVLPSDESFTLLLTDSMGITDENFASDFRAEMKRASESQDTEDQFKSRFINFFDSYVAVGVILDPAINLLWMTFANPSIGSTISTQLNTADEPMSNLSYDEQMAVLNEQLNSQQNDDAGFWKNFTKQTIEAYNLD